MHGTNTTRHKHTDTHANMCINTNHFYSTPQTYNHPFNLSRDTKIPPIRRAREQLGWDLEQRHTHTHTHTDVHRRIHGRLIFNSQWCGKETSGREGRQLEKEANDTETHRHVFKATQTLSPNIHTHQNVSQCSWHNQNYIHKRFLKKP